MGTAYESYVSDSCSSADVEGGYYAYAGGLAGKAHYCRITGCSSTGTVQGGDTAGVGGLAGFNESCTIRDNYALGDVKGGDGATVGGLLGFTFDSEIINNYAAGNAEGGTDSTVGGFAGNYEIDGTGGFLYGYWNIDAEQVIGGTVIEPKKGIGEDPWGQEALLTPKTSDEMKSGDFAELLDENKNDENKIRYGSGIQQQD